MACNFEIENELKIMGYKHIAGVDEAGRGPLAGPVAVAAVVLPEKVSFFDILDDSKKLTENKRDELYYKIIEEAIDYAIILVDNFEIDKLNILNATFVGMCRAVDGLKNKADYAIIDGNQIKGLEHISHSCVVKGDGKSLSIAAASVLAKVTRDRLMINYAQQYPQYLFEKHKGYPTKLHYEMLEKYGPCDIHRRSFRLEAKK